MLNKIIAQKKEEVEQRKRILPTSHLKEFIAQRGAPLDFAHALEDTHIRLIAEVKRASPSRGVLRHSFDPVDLAKKYAQGGAAAISVLTEANYFQGNIDHLSAIRDEIHLPLLRKDFIFDPYQIYESRAYGADALLLIVSTLSQEQLEELLGLSHDLGLSCLVEVHNEEEIERAVSNQAKIIGINNRDLATFTIDVDTTCRLLPLIPQGTIVVSESGIKSRSDVEKLKGWGVNVILVGETLVTASDIIAKMRELII